MNLTTKRIISAVTALSLAAAGAVNLGTGDVQKNETVKAASSYNYAEALQKSMFFYEVQQAGALPEWNSVPWRDNSMVKEDGTSSDKVPGGWFDAGDHFKFTLTNAYSASIMAWGYIQYKDAVDKAGLGDVYKNNIKWALDYVMACDLGGGEMIGTIGDFTGGSTDHNIWCSAEVYMRKHQLNNGDEERPYDTIKNSSVAALSAAALAQGYMIFKDEEYLKHAKDLFEGADKIKACKDIGAMAGMYSTQSWIDDCMYAANWLYMATGDKSYLDKIANDYVPNFPLEEQSSSRKYTWGLCWDDTSQAAAMLYAMNTDDKEWIEHVSHHLDYWIDGYGGKQVGYTPDGLAWLFNWGSARHATTTAWLAKLASDTIFKDDAALSKKYDDWAKSQMDYCLGDNGLKMSYVLGMGDNQPTAFHHRTSSGIHDDHWNDLGQASGGAEGWQTEYAHTLYGALVGGPDKAGKYVNSVAQYEYSEVAIDYNAGWTSALCAMVDDFGGDTLANFPPVETPKWAEWEMAAVLNGSGASYSELKTWAMNHTAWPARVEKDIKFRYFFDVSEVLAGGLSVDDIKIEAKSQQYKEGEQGFGKAAGPFKFEGDPTGNTYYAEISFEDGRAIQPTGQSEHRDEVQFRVSIPDAVDGKPTTGCWDPSNDWSYKGVEDATSLKSDDSINDHITMYINGELVWGEEPDGTKPSGKVYIPSRLSGSGTSQPVVTTPAPAVTTPAPAVTTPAPAVTTPAPAVTTPAPAVTTPEPNGSNNTPAAVVYGDINNDGVVDLSDLTTLSMYLLNDITLSDSQLEAANVQYDDSINVSDLALLKQFVMQDSVTLGPKK